MELVFFHPIPGFLQTGAFLPPESGMIDQQCLAARGGQGVYHIELPVWKLDTQLFCGQEAILIGAGQAGGKDQKQHILPPGQDWR